MALSACSLKHNRPNTLSVDDAVEEMSAGPVFHLDDPDIGIEADFTHQCSFYIGFGYRFRAPQHGDESPI
jgi:hypothetical protein